MNEDRFAEIVKEIRKKNNLTQKEFASKYNVSYQAVSKWENGKNMPDISIIKKISDDYNISFENLIEGEIKSKKNIGKIWSILLLVIIFILIIINIVINKESDFEFKMLTSKCDDFSISGNIAYNDKKSSIFITNISYCGLDKNKTFKSIECILYESYGDLEKKISSYKYNEKNIKLEEFLKQVTLSIDDYEKTCKEYSEHSLYLLINAVDNDEVTTSYKIPLSLDDNCTKLNS